MKPRTRPFMLITDRERAGIRDVDSSDMLMLITDYADVYEHALSVPILINGHPGPANILDTGADNNFISMSVLRDLTVRHINVSWNKLRSVSAPQHQADGSILNLAGITTIPITFVDGTRQYTRNIVFHVIHSNAVSIVFGLHAMRNLIDCINLYNGQLIYNRDLVLDGTAASHQLTVGSIALTDNALLYLVGSVVVPPHSSRAALISTDDADQCCYETSTSNRYAPCQ